MLYKKYNKRLITHQYLISPVKVQVKIREPREERICETLNLVQSGLGVMGDRAYLSQSYAKGLRKIVSRYCRSVKCDSL